MKNRQDLLKRYLSGRAGVAEKQRVDNWYARLDENKSENLTDNQWQQLEDAIWRKLEPKLISKPKIRSLAFYFKVAACVLISAGAVLYTALRITTSNRSAGNELTYQEFKTGLGERKQLTLSDGTSVTLNNASKVRVYDNFSVSRKVDIIDGEAYFDVHHNPGVPFIIHTAAIKVSVLGTAFNIKAYRQLGRVIVSVTRGKVSVVRDRTSLGVLTRTQRLTYNLLTGKNQIQNFTDDVLAWQQGKLYLKNSNFEETSLMLYNQYGKHLITASKDIKNKRFTASLPETLTVYKMAEVIASIHHLKIKQRRDTIEIAK